MKNCHGEAPSGRIYSFDWLRMIAFAVVVLIHCIHMFGTLYKREIGVVAMSDGAAYFLLFVTQWCMSLFFFLAGASTWLVLRRKTPGQFIQERCWRLLVPLAIGFVLLMPFQAYFDMLSNGQFVGTLSEFYPYLLGNILFNGQLHWIFLHIHHLWFLAYLFIFSLIALPLCLLLRSEAGKLWIGRLASVCNRPSGLLVLALPIIGAQIALRATFPMYCGPADALCWLLFYIYGYVLFADPRMRQALQQQGRIMLGLGIVGGVVLLERVGLLHAWMYMPDYAVGCLLFQVLTGLMLGSWVFVTLAYGDKYLTMNCSLLKYGSTASFLWYLIHFPVVVILAYGILSLRLNLLLAFLLIGVGSFVFTFILTDLLCLKMRGMLALCEARVQMVTSESDGYAVPSSPQVERVITGQLNGEPLITGKLRTQPLMV